MNFLTLRIVTKLTLRIMRANLSLDERTKRLTRLWNAIDRTSEPEELWDRFNLIIRLYL